MNSLLDKAQGTALELAMNYVLKDPAHNLSRLVDVVEKFDVAQEHSGQLKVVRPMAADPENNWNQFVVKLCEEIDHEVLKATVRNFFFNASVLGMRKQAESPGEVRLQCALGHPHGPHLRLQPPLHRLLGGGVRQ